MNGLFRRRQLVLAHSMPVISVGRRIDELAQLSPVARVAALVEAAGALAALARKHAELSHVDAKEVAWLVSDPADAMAVLGRGRWLPTMQRPVLAAPAPLEPPTSKRGKRSTSTASSVQVVPGQLALFHNNDSANSSRSGNGSVSARGGESDVR